MYVQTTSFKFMVAGPYHEPTSHHAWFVMWTRFQARHGKLLQIPTAIWGYESCGVVEKKKSKGK